MFSTTASVVTLTLTIASAAIVSAADDVCAVRVSVRSQNSTPISDVPVELLDESGKLVDLKRSSGGVVEFCDFGFGRHSIRVGRESCGAVVLEDIWMDPLRTQEFYVIPRACVEVSSSPGCLAYFRVSSSQDGLLTTASLAGSGLKMPVRSDRYGRIVVGIAPGTTPTFSLRAPDHQEQSLTLECKDSERLQQTVVLVKH